MSRTEEEHEELEEEERVLASSSFFSSALASSALTVRVIVFALFQSTREIVMKNFLVGHLPLLPY